MHDHGQGGQVDIEALRALPDLEYGGDTRPLIDIIQARIDAVAPLMHRTSDTCRLDEAEIRIKFVINRQGYPVAYRIVASQGDVCLQKEVDNVLHMAEPYPYVAGWVPVKLKFTL